MKERLRVISQYVTTTREFTRQRIEQLDWKEDVSHDIRAFIITSDWEEQLTKNTLLKLLNY
ncbi:MAG: hypothetical protein KKD28_03230 [Chloroflexi bacterium]|nr:hypothetical protein [Chloroflexota bacterium]